MNKTRVQNNFVQPELDVQSTPHLSAKRFAREVGAATVLPS